MQKDFQFIMNTGTDVDDSPNVAVGEKVGSALLFDSIRCSCMLICNFLIFVAQARCFRIG